MKAKFRLLYLGTDLELLAAMRQVLPEPDYHLVACSDRGSAVLFLRSEIPYALLLIDLEWRGKEGLNLVKLTHELAHRKRMPIILLAATRSTPHPDIPGAKAGVVEIVAKTKELAGLASAVTRLLSIDRIA